MDQLEEGWIAGPFPFGTECHLLAEVGLQGEKLRSQTDRAPAVRTRANFPRRRHVAPVIGSFRGGGTKTCLAMPKADRRSAYKQLPVTGERRKQTAVALVDPHAGRMRGCVLGT